jgi:hypothetical protein
MSSPQEENIRPCMKTTMHDSHTWPMSAMGGDEPTIYTCSGVTNEDYIRHVMPALKQCDEFATHLPHGHCPGKESAEEMPDELRAVKNAHAHQLAERQRAWAKEQYDQDIYVDEMTYGLLKKQADLIDPEVQR